MDMGLNGKTALVTGGSKGIGLAVAHGLAAEGCNLHLAARGQEGLDAAAEEIRGRHNVSIATHAADLSNPDELDALAEACKDVDILINNAGAIPRGTLLDLDDQKLREVWELKLFGYINMTRHLYGHMKSRGSGVIVNIIGGAADVAPPDYIAGAMANIALVNLTKALGKESTFHGVRVIGMHPAATLTERLAFLFEERAQKQLGDKTRWKEVLPKLPFNRPTEPSEVADMVVFLASERAGYSSGVVYSISGGVAGGE